jgi:hypothetical protein
VTTTALGRVVCGLDFLPLLGLEIEAVKIVKSDSLVVNTTMTSEQVNFAIKKGGSCVGTRCRGSMNRVLVLGSSGRFALCALPSKSIDG